MTAQDLFLILENITPEHRAECELYIEIQEPPELPGCETSTVIEVDGIGISRDDFSMKPDSIYFVSREYEL